MNVESGFCPICGSPNCERLHGASGWLLLASGVFIWDVLAPETLSSAFSRGFAHRRGRPTVVIGWLAISAHLFGILPHRYDPLHQTLTFIRRLQ